MRHCAESAPVRAIHVPYFTQRGMLPHVHASNMRCAHYNVLCMSGFVADFLSAPSERDAYGAARAWFAAQGWSPFPFQEEVWAAFAAGESGLVHAPTGMGKTYAAWIPPLMHGPAGAPDSPPPLTVLWITPLRALAADTGLALARAAAALQPHWSVDVRTGDTASSARARQA